LPFVSYGGSSLLVSAAAMGILLNVSRARRSPRRNLRTDGLEPEASATVATAAAFGGEERRGTRPDQKKRRPRRTSGSTEVPA